MMQRKQSAVGWLIGLQAGSFLVDSCGKNRNPVGHEKSRVRLGVSFFFLFLRAPRVGAVLKLINGTLHYTALYWRHGVPAGRC